MMVSFSQFLVFTILSGRCCLADAFSPPNLSLASRTTKKNDSNRRSSHLSPIRSTTVSRQRTQGEFLKYKEDQIDNTGFINDITKSNYRLDLDPLGQLRIGVNNEENTVLLNGLTPSVWSASRPTTGEVDGIFLHTKQPTQSSALESSLGDLISCNRLLACARLNRYWMGPAFGNSGTDVPLDTQFLLVEIVENEQYALVLPLIDCGFRASLHYGGSNINVVCHAESSDASVQSSGMRALYVAVGDDPFDLLKRGFAHVAEATGTFATLDQKTLPPIVDDFGWCTWDAFYSDVSPAGVLDGVKTLREAGVPPKNLILDDGWQEVSPQPSKWAHSVSNEKHHDERGGILSAIPNFLFGVLANVVGFFYENFVRKAPNGALANKVWRFLANTVLKGPLWNHFNTETDFNRQMSDFEPNHKFGGNGLKNLVTELKQNLGVRRVYCWHALHGYWRGVSPELGKKAGIDVKNYNPNPSKHLLDVEPQIAWDTAALFGVGLMTTQKDLTTFYKHLHTPLVDAGVDGVKVDVQSGVSAMGGNVGGGPHIAKLYTEAMEESVSTRFTTDDGATNCINCMCHSTENLYRHKATSIARASDDFFPNRPDSHTVHLVNVVYNSLFIGEICLPDWDMFHSKHESAELHAAARSVGGCPVYVSDKPGQHDPDLLKRLVLPDGSVLRAKLPGRPTRDCLFVDVGTDDVSALKVWNSNTYGGVIGTFNVQGVAWNFDTHENEVVNESPSSLVASVKPCDIETLRRGDVKTTSGPFVAWSHKSSTLTYLPNSQSTIEKSLNHREWEIYTIVPVQSTTSSSSNAVISWAPIGLSNMYNTGGAIQDVGELENTSKSTTTTKFVTRGPGNFVAYCQPKPSSVFITDDSNETKFVNLSFTYDETNGQLSFTLPNEEVGGSGGGEIINGHQVTVTWNHHDVSP